MDTEEIEKNYYRDDEYESGESGYLEIREFLVCNDVCDEIYLDEFNGNDSKRYSYRTPL